MEAFYFFFNFILLLIWILTVPRVWTLKIYIPSAFTYFFFFIFISRREAALRQENAELMKQFQMAENRNEELAEAVSSATRPLTKQLENLTTSHANAAANWEKQEQILSQKLGNYFLISW